MTIRMRGFDKTMAAVKALGPEAAAKSLPGLAMAKGLAKTESDGSLELARRTRPGPLDQGQRHPARQGAGIEAAAPPSLCEEVSEAAIEPLGPLSPFSAALATGLLFFRGLRPRLASP